MNEIRSHLEPPEPKGMHPLVDKENMDSVQTNYKSDNDIQKELANVNLDNFLDFDYNGQYEFVRCAYCSGPLLGHIEAKCPRLEYDDGKVKRFETHLKGFNGFRQPLKKRES